MKSEAEKFQMEHAGLVARSTQGHAAKGMKIKDQEDMWVSIQHNTFKNWVNVQLRDSGLKVEDLNTDLMDGLALLTLVEVLQQRRLKKITKVINQHQALENVTTALNAIAEDGIKLVNIGNVDIVNGNLKLILGLIWSLIMHYQIGQTKFPPKKLMLAWLKAVLPDCNVNNFTSDWNSGKNLSALLDYCKPGLFTSWKNINLRDPVHNCKKAMHIANKEFNIPMVLEPEYLASPYLDDLSGMTYLSYFMKEGGPGYNSTLKWVQKQLPNKNITNFTTNWNDGTNLSSLIKNLGGPVKGFKNMSKHPSKWESNLNAAIEAGEKLGVAPVLSAQDMARPDVDHLGPLTYISYFQWVKPRQCPSDNVRICCNVDHIRVNNPVSFDVEFLTREVNARDVKIKVLSPTGEIKVDIDLGHRGARGTFVPMDVGFYDIKVTHEDEPVEGSPIKVRVLPDISKIMFSGIDPCALGSIVEVLINSNGAGQGQIEVAAISPTRKILPCPVKEEFGVYAATFQPDEAGKWLIGVTYDEEHIQGSPFACFVYDPNAIKIRNLDDGPGSSAGRQFILMVDATECGQGDVKADVTHNGKSIPSKTLEVDNSYYEILFLPLEAARYKIYLYFNGHEVRGSPFSFYLGINKPPERKSKSKKSSKNKTTKYTEPIIKEYSSKIDSPARYNMENSSNIINKSYDSPTRPRRGQYATLDDSKLSSSKYSSKNGTNDYYRSLDSSGTRSKDAIDGNKLTDKFSSTKKNTSFSNYLNNSMNNYGSNSRYTYESKERSTSPLNRKLSSSPLDNNGKRGLGLFSKERSPEFRERIRYDLSPSRTNKITGRDEISNKYFNRSEETKFSSSYRSYDRSLDESVPAVNKSTTIKNYSDEGTKSRRLVIDSNADFPPSRLSQTPDQPKNLSSPAKVLEISQNAAKTTEEFTMKAVIWNRD